MSVYIGNIPAARPLQDNFDDRELGERAHFLFEYDPETGAVVSRFTTNLATYPTATGHSLIRVDGRSFSAAVIVWVMHHFARPGKKTLKRVDKKPANHRIENLICGQNEIVDVGSAFVPKVCLPGQMPAWLPRCRFRHEAERAIAHYVAEHKDDPIPPCKAPDDVLKELRDMGHPARTYAPGESRLNPYLKSILLADPKTFRGKVPPSTRQDIDDLI